MNADDPVTLALNAMATRFELVMYGPRKDHLYSAGQEALEEIERLDAQLSFYRQDSDINDLNVRAAWAAVPVEPRLFQLISRSIQLSEISNGAFDITIAPLMRCWGLAGGEGRVPNDEELIQVREKVGWKHLILDEGKSTIRFDKEGVQVDLGSIGKGYAIDRAVGILQEHEITSALLHGGTSSVYAIGTPPYTEGWKIAIQKPEEDLSKIDISVMLKDEALSVSAPHGKWFESGGKRYGHVINPITGYPEGRSLLAALVTQSAAEGDALSTAILTKGASWLPELATIENKCRAFLIVSSDIGEVERVNYQW